MLKNSGKDAEPFYMISKNVIIIGAGPAGIAAAIQLSRAGIDFAIFEKGEIGGLVRNANLIENFPGILDKLSGIEFAARLASQLEHHNIDVIHEEVVEIFRNSGVFIVRTLQREYSSNCLIVASGTIAKEIDGKRKMFYDVCPLLDIHGKKIAIIGGGDAAFDYALNLSKNNNVSIFFRREIPVCLPLLYERARINKNIEIYSKSDFCNCDTTLQNQFDYVLAATGREPNVKFLQKDLLNARVENLYMAGDVCRGKLRQLAIAIGDGMRAAQDIIGKVASTPSNSPFRQKAGGQVKGGG